MFNDLCLIVSLVTVLQGQAIYTGTEVGFTSLVYPENPGNSNESFSG